MRESPHPGRLALLLFTSTREDLKELGSLIWQLPYLQMQLKENLNRKAEVKRSKTRWRILMKLGSSVGRVAGKTNFGMDPSKRRELKHSPPTSLCLNYRMDYSDRGWIQLHRGKW